MSNKPLPKYGDRIGILQWLHEHAALYPILQKSPLQRRNASSVIKRMRMLKPPVTEKEFCEAMTGVYRTNEILYSLTLHVPRKPK